MQFVEYERMVYLDADIQVFENTDELFELEKGYLYAVMDCFCEEEWRHTSQYKIGYCQQCPDKVPWPTTAELGPAPSLYFNAGMFVHEPSKATAKVLLDTLRVTPPTTFAEQVSESDTAQLCKLLIYLLVLPYIRADERPLLLVG
jgi:inositol 3-alpha-galactosyltransferase